MKYIDNLIEQFISSTGISKHDLNSKEFLREFSNWVDERQLLSKNFVYLLFQMGIDISNYNTAEIGKTSFDSIGKNHYTTIITPYAFGFDRRKDFIESPFVVTNNGNIIISKSKEQLEAIRQYMTHNPYNEESIKNWDKLHNNGKNIVLGIFGRPNDKDIYKKIMMLEKFKELLDNNYIEEETSVYDTYCKIIASNRKTDIKTKCK